MRRKLKFKTKKRDFKYLKLITILKDKIFTIFDRDG